MYEMHLKDDFGSQILVGLGRKILQEPYFGKPRGQLYSFQIPKDAESGILHTHAEQCWEMRRISRISEKMQFPKSSVSPGSVNHKAPLPSKVFEIF